MRRPTQDDRCSLVLRTVGWTTQGQLGSASRVPLGSGDAVHKHGELTLASSVMWAGA